MPRLLARLTCVVAGHPAALHIDLVYRCRRCHAVLGQLTEPAGRP